MIDRKHFLALDSLRGICASFVVFYHFHGDSWVKSVPFIKNAFLFVDFFFVLSGFVIAASYGAKIGEGYPISRFMFLRLGRLYPLHLVVLLAYLVIVVAKNFLGESGPYTSSNFLLSAFLLQVWTPYGGLDLNPWNPPSWSISAEIWTYLLFALVCKAAKGNVNFTLAILVVACVPILIFGTDRYLDVCFSGGGFVRCVFGFSFGVLAYSAWSSGCLDLLKDLPSKVLTAIEILLCSACLVLVSIAGATVLSLFCPVLFALTVCVFAYEAGAISRGLLTSPFLTLGLFSYSIYMVHEFVLARLVNATAFLSKHFQLPVIVDPLNPFSVLNAPGWTFAADVAALMFYACIIAVSYLTFHFIEDPCRNWSRVAVKNATQAAARAI